MKIPIAPVAGSERAEAFEALDAEVAPSSRVAWPLDGAFPKPGVDAIPIDATARLRQDRSVRSMARSRMRRDLLARELGVQLRHVFVLMGEFLGQCQSGSQGQGLLAVLDDVIRGAVVGFALAGKLHTVSARDNADKQSCLDDLGQLRTALAQGIAMSPHDLKHAMDALIVQFVRVDALRQASARPRSVLQAAPGNS
jgi:hypothetical protein